MSHRIFAAAVLLAAALSPVPASADALGGADRNEPLARFADPICPGIVGLEVAVAEAMVGRIRQHAEELGLPLGDPASCEPNVIATFVADGKDYITRLEKRQGWMFIDMTREEREALFKAPGNIRTWTRTVVRNRDGMPIARREGLSELPEAPMWMAHSRIYVATRRDFLASMVIFDRDAIDGMSVFQLADYVTIRALGGEAFHEIAPPGGTILALPRDGAGAPKALTAADWTYLRTLYGTMPNLPAAVTLATVQKRIDTAAE